MMVIVVPMLMLMMTIMMVMMSGYIQRYYPLSMDRLSIGRTQITRMSIERDEHMNTGRTSKQITCLCRDTEGKGTLPAQRTGFNTLENYGHKIPTQTKRIKYKKEKIKGTWPGICIQYTRLHVHTCISLRVQSLSETGKMTTKSC